jgi:hypothetical protein
MSESCRASGVSWRMSYKVHGLGEILDQVEDVVHAHDQLVDLVAIERRVERGVQQGDGLVGDLVGRGSISSMACTCCARTS